MGLLEPGRSFFCLTVFRTFVELLEHSRSVFIMFCSQRFYVGDGCHMAMRGAHEVVSRTFNEILERSRSAFVFLYLKKSSSVTAINILTMPSMNQLVLRSECIKFTSTFGDEIFIHSNFSYHQTRNLISKKYIRKWILLLEITTYLFMNEPIDELIHTTIIR